MGARSRVRQAREIADVFETPDTGFDDEQSESETEDHVETESAHESEEDADSDAEQVEAGEEGSSGESSTQQQAQPLRKRQRRASYLRSKSGFAWSQNAPESLGRRSRTDHVASPEGQALNVSTPLESWTLLFTTDILNIIVTHTNGEIARKVEKMKEKGQRVETYQKPVDLVELKALIGLLYFAGLHKVNNTCARNLWSPYGMSLFRLTMPENRFQFLLLSVRFDDINTRTERKAEDRLANIREIWDMFIANCMSNYQPHATCTIGAQLLSFRGRCIFRMHMPAKQDEYGLKIVTINDATTHYLFNAIPYVGVVNADPAEAVPSYYVRKLSEPIYHTGRNITCGNWFTSIPICEKMKKDYNLTMVGAIRKNEHEIPEAFKKIPPRGTNVQFAYHEGKTLVSYNSKPRKIVLLLSSLHVNGKINQAAGKPEIVVFYNKTKGGSDSFDKKCHDYTTNRKTRQWPMRLFYGMLDQANVNCLILYTLRKDNVKMSRHNFILDLSLALIKPLLSRRLTSSTLRTTLRVQIEAFLECKDIPEDQDPRDLMAGNKMEKQKRCGFCPVSLDRKTCYKCLKCDRPMCREHVAKICCDCSVDMNK